MVRTISTSFISGTGLKKCSPSIRSGRPLSAAMAMIVRLDVFDAKLASGRAILSSCAQSVFLTSRSSTTASMKRSESARSLRSVVKRRLARVLSRSASVTLPRSIPLASVFSIESCALSARAVETSRTVVGNPAAAETWAMPLPMSPPPRTPTFWIFFIAGSTPGAASV